VVLAKRVQAAPTPAIPPLEPGASAGMEERAWVSQPRERVAQADLALERRKTTHLSMAIF
jgi:hypothetical protein